MVPIQYQYLISSPGTIYCLRMCLEMSYFLRSRVPYLYISWLWSRFITRSPDRLSLWSLWTCQWPLCVAGHRSPGLEGDGQHGRGGQEPGQQWSLLLRGTQRGHAHLVLSLRRKNCCKTWSRDSEASKKVPTQFYTQFSINEMFRSTTTTRSSAPALLCPIWKLSEVSTESGEWRNVHSLMQRHL